MLQRPPITTRPLIYCRLLLTAALVTGGVTAAGLSRAAAADPTGDWKVADGVANIRVAECNGSMWGVVSWEKAAGGIDRNNPDASKQTRPTLGMAILIDMKKKASVDQWEGQVYNAKDGKLYESTIKPVGSDKLEIQGCVLGFLCGGETWTRVAGPIPSSPSNSNPANSMAKGPAKPGGIKTSGLPGQPVPAPASPAKTTGQKAAVPGQKTAAAAQADPVGDICLLPEVARPAH